MTCQGGLEAHYNSEIERRRELREQLVKDLNKWRLDRSLTLQDILDLLTQIMLYEKSRL